MLRSLRAARIFRNQPLHPLAKSINSTILAGIVIQLSNVVGGIVLARSLGASGRGFVAAAMLWPPLLASLVGLGISDALLVRSARSEDAVARALWAAMLIGACQSLLAIACGWIILPRVLGQMPPEVVTISRGYLAFIPLNLATVYIGVVLQARGYRFNLVRATVHVAYTLLLLFVLVIGLIDPLTVIIASLGANGVTLLLETFLLRRKGWWHPQSAVVEARKLVGFGSRVHVGTLASIVVARLDLVVLTAFVSAAELGNYAISAIPGSALTLLPASATLAVYPAVVRMLPAEVSTTIARCVVLFSLMILLAFIVAFTLPFTIPLLFGPGYQRAVPIGQILTFGITIRSSAGLLGAVLRGMSRPLSSGLGDIVGLPVFAVLLLLMVPPWRGIGAAIALSAAASIGFLVILGMCMRTVGMTGRDLIAIWRHDADLLGTMIRTAWVEPTGS